LNLLQIQTEARGHTLIVHLAGEFDLSGLRDFQRALLDCRPPQVERLCVDLRELSFLGASALRALLNLHSRAGRDGFDLFVVNGGPLVRRVFQMTGVDRRLEMIEDPASLAT
jgi:stage II sporulation protein AA (anti-sigma F factor antagonist)